MIAQVIAAYLHFIGIMALMATLLAEHATLQPNMTRIQMQRLVSIDQFYGIAAVLVLVTGVLRFAYFAKGMPFYLANPLFYIKVGIFVAVGLISIYPTRRFLSWQRMLRQDQLPEVDDESVTRLRVVVRLELGLLLIMPLLAVLMARGIGITSP